MKKQFRQIKDWCSLCKHRKEIEGVMVRDNLDCMECLFWMFRELIHGKPTNWIDKND